jgi:hypothetical protein
MQEEERRRVRIFSTRVRRIIEDPRSIDFLALTAVNVGVSAVRIRRVLRKERPSITDPELLAPGLALAAWVAYATPEIRNIGKVINKEPIEARIKLDEGEELGEFDPFRIDKKKIEKEKQQEKEEREKMEQETKKLREQEKRNDQRDERRKRR